ncbi:RagB/SusD family nutrient uptake outer membrane protein [Massilibacteroides sp.]|uniref:RagB/SusD family nutrient uptake outer membrane protein n=1 Tax=Massilibacteroides sp. TaxID=2034766 RepID=UPI0026386A5D|nr:RagB/SusD family nutrient uptake outer membrane protein [Massilibacteroides sp.]MDD4514717.1 RagB/SusD family nutrient uptake outer membrane protein [Massilibacteroides sp.]
MKNTTKYLLLLMSIGMLSCNDNLNVSPYIFTSDKDYYKTEDQIKSAINGVYDKLQDIYRGDHIYIHTEMRADNTSFQYYETDRGVQQREDINDFLMTASNVYNQNVWDRLYDGIQQTNAIISHISNIEYKDSELKNQHEGEARFLRAFFYFHLVRLWGEVPLREKPTTGPSDAFTSKKGSIDEIYTFIKQDVNISIEKLPVKYNNEMDKGRLTKGAAYTLMGEICMTYKQDYEAAANYFTEVTKLGYQLLTGENGYASLFDPTNKNHAESIFEVQYSSVVEGEHSDYIFIWGPKNARSTLINTAWTGEMGGSNIPTLDIIQAYEPGDIRKDASIGYFVNQKNRVYQESLGKDLTVVGDSIAYIKKFYHTPYTVDGRADENWPIYRYGYLKLLLAEALNETGKSAEALIHLNEVRKRAGLEEIKTTNQTELREAIFKEIRVEVAFENHRWYQLLRTGRAIEIMNEHGKKEKKRLNEAAKKLGQVCHLIDASYNIQPYKLLFPIPERECRLNGFKNNEGWY